MRIADSLDMQRRRMLGAFAAMPLLSLPHSVNAQQRRQILKIICAFAPGGPTDLLSRKVGAAIPSTYASSVVVENKTGAAGQLAVSYVKQLPTDGTNILQTAMSAFTLSPFVQTSLPYDAVADCLPLTAGVSVDYVYAVGPMVPASVKNVSDYLAWVKLDPKHAPVATAGIVSLVIAAVLGKVAGVDLVNVSYKGGILAVQDTIAGNSPALITSIADVFPYLGEGRLRLLAVTSDKRSVHVPDVPTFIEQGLADMVHKIYFSFFAPPKTPTEIVAAHSAALRTALTQRDVALTLARAKMDVLATDPRETAEIVAQDRAKWAALTARIGYKPT